jgi:hypothetical protein
MNKYKRRTINQKAHLHDKEFVEYGDVEEILVKFAHVAIKAGADESDILDFLRGKGDEEIT